MPNYLNLAQELRGLVESLGVSTKELQDLFNKGGPAHLLEEKVRGVEEVLAKVSAVASSTPVTEAERQSRIAQLEEDLKVLQIVSNTDPDFRERQEAQREMARLSSQLGVYKAQDVLKFENLLDDTQNELKLTLAEAAKDIASRQNLKRILKGVEVLARAAAFTAALAAKLALSPSLS